MNEPITRSGRGLVKVFANDPSFLNAAAPDHEVALYQHHIVLRHVLRIEAEAAAPREAPDQRLRDLLRAVADNWHVKFHGDATLEHCGWPDCVEIAAALATEGEP